MIDFGVAKATGGSLTESTLFTGFAQMVGTPLYMSPEQAGLSGVDVDTRSDIYSLGVLLYELLTGTTPFDREAFREAAFDEVRRIIREQEPPKPSTRLSSLGYTITNVSTQRGAEARQLNRTVRGELDWIAMKALEKDRRRRYETANDFAADVMRYLTNRPVEACPPSAWYRFRKLAHRHWRALGVTLLISWALILGTLISTWQAYRAARAERLTAAALADARAERRQARKAVDEMYSQVAEKWLAQQPKLTALQREFLEKALAFYEQFAVARGDDAETRFEAARARCRAGRLQLSLGRMEQARAALRQSIEQLEALVERFPDRVEYVSELSLVRVDLAGYHVLLGRLNEAEPLLKKSVAAMESQVPRNPKDREAAARLAECLVALGRLLERQGRNQEAETSFLRGRDLFSALDAEARLKPGDGRQFAQCEMDLGIIFAKTGRFPEAEQAFLRAIKLQETLLADNPADPSSREALAIDLCNLASTQNRIDRSKDALANDRRCIALLEVLAKEFPEILRYRGRLLECQSNLAISLRGMGFLEEAERVARQAVELGETLVREHPDIPEYRDKLVLVLSDLAGWYAASPANPAHSPARALEMARKATDLDPENGIALQSLGWAQYRAGDSKSCIGSWEKSKSDPRDGDFIAAMAYWQLGEKAHARVVFDRAEQWLAGYERRWNAGIFPDPSMLREVRAEAAKLLGVEPAHREGTGKPRP